MAHCHGNLAQAKCRTTANTSYSRQSGRLASAQVGCNGGCQVSASGFRAQSTGLTARSYQVERARIVGDTAFPPSYRNSLGGLSYALQSPPHWPRARRWKDGHALPGFQRLRFFYRLGVQLDSDSIIDRAKRRATTRAQLTGTGARSRQRLGCLFIIRTLPGSGSRHLALNFGPARCEHVNIQLSAVRKQTGKSHAPESIRVRNVQLFVHRFRMLDTPLLGIQSCKLGWSLFGICAHEA